MDALFSFIRMKTGSAPPPPPPTLSRRRRRRPRRNGKRPYITIDQSAYSWIENPEDQEAVRSAIMRAVESKYEEAHLTSVVVKNDVGSGHYKAVVIWKDAVPVSAVDDLNFILEASPRIHDVIVTYGSKPACTIMTVLIKATELAQSAKQSDAKVYTRPKKRSKTSE